jgi:hypothetical protein
MRKKQFIYEKIKKYFKNLKKKLFFELNYLLNNLFMYQI